MNDRSESAEKHLEQLLAKLGFDVKQIPISTNRKADFYVSDEDGSKYIIEVRIKIDNGIFKKELKEKGIAIKCEKQEIKSTLTTLFRDKTHQLSETTCQKSDYRLLWLYALGDEPKNQIAQCEATLMGRVDIIIRDEQDGSNKDIPCYFFNYADFHKRRELDGVIASTYKEARFLLNPFSPRAKNLRNTKLCNYFRQNGALVDPLQNKTKERVFVVDDFKLSRKNKKEVLEWVKKKYKLSKAFDIQWTYEKSAAVI